MNKAIKYATNGALIVGVANSILNITKQYNDKDANFTFNWSECIKAFGKGAVLGGVGGLVFGAIRDNEMDHILFATGGTAGFLNEMLESYSDNDNFLPKKAQIIQRKLNDEFGEYLSEYPAINGSSIKGTAIHNSDIDIQLKFNKNASNIDEIRNMVEVFIEDKFYDKKLLKVRSQDHSIGLFYAFNGEEKRIDIVPLREVENGKGDTYLYSTKRQSLKKTNSLKQLSHLKFTEKQKKIIKLLKGWKIDNGLKISSTLIEHIVKRAFNQHSIPRGLEKGLLFLIEFIAQNIQTLKIIDPANTNNVISNYLSMSEKVYLSDFCFNMLDEIKKDHRNLIDYFDY